MKKPNLLLIFTDQQRWDTLAAYGNDVIQTPNLDKMAKEGAVFENAITPSPLCGPARACTVSGLAAGKIGCFSNAGPKNIDEADTLPTHLTNNGYHTQAIGKMHFSNKPYEQSYGMDNMILSEEMRGVRLAKDINDIVFDDYDKYLMEKDMWGWEKPPEIGYNEIKPVINPLPKEYHITQWCGDETIKWLTKDRPKDKPFFLWTSFVKPHVPYDCPQHLKSMYSIDQLTTPWVSENDGSPKNPVYKQIRKDNEFDLYSEEAALLSRAYYYANISFIDEQIGRIFDTLKREGLDNNTLVIFTSDHGDLMGDHNIWYKKVGYEGSVHIPMLAWWPGVIAPDTRCDEVTSLLDIFPTFMETAGLFSSQERPGVNLLNLLSEKCSIKREICVSEMGFPPYYMLHVRSKEFKYMFYQNGGYEELYDLKEDPHEMYDLSENAKYLSVKEELKAAAIDWITKYSDPNYALDDVGMLRVEEAKTKITSDNPRPFSRMPWDLRMPPKELGKQHKGWFWDTVDGDWSKVIGLFKDTKGDI